MLKIEKTLQSVRDLLDRLSKEGVEFALVESECSGYIADIRNPNKVYVFLECSIRPDGTFVWWDYDRHKGVCDFDEFRVRIITLAADEYLDKAKGKRKQWASLCDSADTPMPESLAAVVSDMENKANRLKALLESDDPPLLDGRDIAILKDLKPYGVVKPAEESQRLRELGVLERRYYIDQVFDALTDKGEKALEFASHVERTKRRRTSSKQHLSTRPPARRYSLHCKPTETTCACAIRANGAFLLTRNSDGSAIRSRRTCRMRAIWTTTACSTAPGVRPWIAATRCLMRANTAYPACSLHSTTRPYGRRYAPDLTC